MRWGRHLKNYLYTYLPDAAYDVITNTIENPELSSTYSKIMFSLNFLRCDVIVLPFYIYEWISMPNTLISRALSFSFSIFFIHIQWPLCVTHQFVLNHRRNCVETVRILYISHPSSNLVSNKKVAVWAKLIKVVKISWK